ncbi:MAG: glycosyltransferase family 2 protein [Bacteroidales bacterium]|nr:glycosyltransferase family 2 protein [Bacteroidales bacterium]HNW74012.1 glycosyltransferase family 2 protein [Bacteroidales bacterium]HPS50610.1 glycosyltransferase family 2 protein [Bacteroidales bacterium]
MNTLFAIPAYQEATRIGKLLDLMAHLRKDTLVIDDGSTDATSEVVQNRGFRLIRHPENGGLEAAYESANLYARSNHYTQVIALDADGQHDPAYLPEFIRGLGHYDLVSGDRFHNLQEVPESKIASNLFAILLVREATGILLPDVSCGFRGWKLTAGELPQQKQIARSGSGHHRFGAIYRMLLDHLAIGETVGFVKIPAIYPPENPTHTRVQEIVGLVSALLNFRPSAKLQSILRDVRDKKHLTMNIQDLRFELVPETADAYRFVTDPEMAVNRMTSIHR